MQTYKRPNGLHPPTKIQPPLPKRNRRAFPEGRPEFLWECFCDGYECARVAGSGDCEYTFVVFWGKRPECGVGTDQKAYKGNPPFTRKFHPTPGSDRAGIEVFSG